MDEFVKFSRKFFDSEEWRENRSFSRAEAWIFLVSNAATEDSPGIKRGQVSVSYRKLAARWQRPVSWVRTAIAAWKEKGYVTTDTRHGTIVITVSGFDKFVPKPRVAKSPPKESPEDLLNKRKHDFGLELVPFVEKYGRLTVREFFDYWTETNASKTKMRYEQQPTWELEKRIALWANKERNYANAKNQQRKSEAYGVPLSENVTYQGDF